MFDENLFDEEELPDLSSDEEDEVNNAPPPGFEPPNQPGSSVAIKQKSSIFDNDLTSGKALKEKLNM